MDNQQIKNFIESSRKSGISDDKIYSFLQAKGAIPAEQLKREGETGFSGFRTGLGQSALGVLKGTAQFGEEIGQTILGKKLVPGVYSDEQIEERAREKGGVNKLFTEDTLTPKTGAEKAGKFTGDVAQYVIPGSKVTKLSKASRFLRRVVPRAVSSGTVATLQEGKVGAGTGIAVGAEIVLPGVGKLLSGVFKKLGTIGSRLLKGFGADIDTIRNNPQAILNNLKKLKGADKEALDKVLTKETNIVQSQIKSLQKTVGEQTTKLQEKARPILEKTATKIQNGIFEIRQNARDLYGEGLGKLKSIDINPTKFRASIQLFLDDIGSFVEGDTRILKNVEFSDPINMKKASGLIDDLTNTKLDGLSLRKLLDKAKKLRYKTATSDERLSFNAFISEFEKSIKNTISSATNKLDDINAAFSKDMQLVETIENIFGKQKFKSRGERLKIAEKLKKALEKTSLTKSEIDDFFAKIKVNPDNIRNQIGSLDVLNTSESKFLSEIEGIFGNVKNIDDFAALSTKVKNAMRKTDLEENVIDRLLRKAGLDPTEFRAGEEVRRVLTEKFAPEAPGGTRWEVIRQFTAGLVSPVQATKFAALIEQLPERVWVKVLGKIQNATSTIERETIVKTLVDLFGED